MAQKRCGRCRRSRLVRRHLTMPHTKLKIINARALGAVLLSSLAMCGPTVAAAAAAATDKPVTLMVEAEDFQFTGDWLTQSYEGERMLISPLKAGRYPAATAVGVPRAGRYRLWVRAMDFPADRPGTRVCTASVA